MATQCEMDAMRLAIALSARGLGTTSPNPPVGCVILDSNGEIAGTGYHTRKGEAHAETNALMAAGGRAEGGTAVVTLEPCNHAGRTPACRQVLQDAKVARVVIALLDPTSHGEGGAAMLRAAGVDVEVGVLTDEARLVLGPWLDALERQRPHVLAAYTLDGHNAYPLDAHHLAGLRVGVDAVLQADSRIEEAIADSHGSGVLSLPTDPLTGTPEDQLNTVYSAGVRLLLIPNPDLAHTYAAAGLVDQLTLYATLAITADASSRLGWPIPSGYRLSRLSVAAGGVRLECSPID